MLNSRGELIGINTAIYSRSGTSSGVGFAIPVSTVERVVPQLIQYGRVRDCGSAEARIAVRKVICLGFPAALRSSMEKEIRFLRKGCETGVKVDVKQ